MRPGIRVVGAFVIFFFSVYTLGWAFTTVPESQDEMELLVIQAREMIQQGHFNDAVTVLQRLLPQATEKKDQARIRLLLSQAYLSDGNAEACEESLRAVFENQLQSQVNPTELEVDLRVVFNKIRAEYWYRLGAVESVEERLEKRVIARPARKPEKKPLWPKLVAGAVVIGVIVTLVLLFSGSKRDAHGEGWEGETGLVFENTSHFPVAIKISTYRGEVPGDSTMFIALHPGDYRLTVTHLSSTYSYFVRIRQDERAYFEFIPST